MSKAVTTSGIKRAVYEGRISHTSGRLTESQLKENKRGRVVSVAGSNAAKKNYKKQGNSGPKGWMTACKHAASDLGHWPVPVKKGTEFYKLAKKYHKDMVD